MARGAGDAAAAAAAIAAGAEVNAADEDGWTALHLAALNDRAAVVELLLAQPGVDVNARTKWRSTPLILAVSRGHAAPARLLLDHPGIEIDARADCYGRTALIEAARHGHLELAALLLGEGGGRAPARQTGRNSALIVAMKSKITAKLFNAVTSTAPVPMIPNTYLKNVFPGLGGG